uniref:Uncharacterized protein n=2 Tax=Nicotiana TaxID=4085 RepID=A0A1S3X8I2_TOBAC|nr:PREDICTED: uncharacterized protein LOC104237488 [Nicotiana sylvestris]XP_016436325.1 PREDICTED: uncharacterized protein LOC107762474 [Nicotiana tabacum]
MSGYTKFMKDLVIKKKNINFDIIKVTHQCSAIISQTGVKKMEDPGAFAIPCAIGLTSFAKALCDSGASNHLMPYAVFKKLVLGGPRPTSMKLLMADRTLKRLLGVIYDILSKWIMVDEHMQDIYMDEALHTVLLNSENDSIEGYIEAVMAL